MPLFLFEFVVLVVFEKDFRARIGVHQLVKFPLNAGKAFEGVRIFIQPRLGHLLAAQGFLFLLQSPPAHGRGS